MNWKMTIAIASVLPNSASCAVMYAGDTSLPGAFAAHTEASTAAKTSGYARRRR